MMKEKPDFLRKPTIRWLYRKVQYLAPHLAWCYVYGPFTSGAMAVCNIYIYIYLFNTNRSEVFNLSTLKAERGQRAR